MVLRSKHICGVFSNHKKKICLRSLVMYGLSVCLSLPPSLSPLPLSQVHNQTISQTLEQTQTVEQYLQDSDQLRSQLNVLQQQQAVVMADKVRTLEDNRLLGVAVADLRVSVQGLEATKEQLEADRYTAQTSLDKVEQEYHQVLFIYLYAYLL